MNLVQLVLDYNVWEDYSDVVHEGQMWIFVIGAIKLLLGSIQMSQRRLLLELIVL